MSGIAVNLLVVALAATLPAGAQAASKPTRDPLAVKCKGRAAQGCRPASEVAQELPLPAFVPEAESTPTETLAQALDDAYRTAPSLEAQRYTLRASDEDYAIARSELRATSQIQVTGDYSKTVPGRTSQANRFLAKSPIITSNTLSAEAAISQPLYTGGKASADAQAAIAAISAGRAQLRGVEGDLLLAVITAYADIRRDSAALALRAANLKQLQATLDEVKARRRAGELTRTDIGLAENQLDLAETQYNLTAEQLEQSRTTFAALVGRTPGNLAPPPPLPHVPANIDVAFSFAEDLSPDLAQAIAAEKASRARIAAAKATGRPTVTLTGTATLTGQAAPYYLHNEDQVFAGRAVLTIPLTNGGRVGATVAQAEDRNAADRVGIEAARRQMVATIVNAWNALATSQRNISVGERQVAAARIYDDGTFKEYRAGLRSTFDVLYAHAALRDAEIAKVSAMHDLFVAQATLLRRIGLLEARSLLTGTGLYNPDANFAHAASRGGLPWDGAVRALDHVVQPSASQKALEQPSIGPGRPAMAPPPAPEGSGREPAPPLAPLATTSSNTPLPGTTGKPLADRSLARP